MLKLVGKTEIGNDHISVTVEEQVLQLEVAMDNFLLVDVPNTGDELREQLGSVLFAEITMGQDVVEEFSSRRVFQDDADVLVRLNHVVETDDVGVFQGLVPRSAQGRYLG
jgi:hypothetical protein